jgi:para-aminobenzoate synthetase/4-amino-4-deoxychorismate lyase
MHAPAEPFALLDDCTATPGRPSSRLYTGFVREHRCENAATLDALWEEVQRDQQAGLHAVVLADYEWGLALVGLPPRSHALAEQHGAPPALRVLMFARLRYLSRDEVDGWLASPSGAAVTHGGTPRLSPLTPTLGPQAYAKAIARIHDAIRAGETYQVNHTHRLRGELTGSPVALYRLLRARQPVPYGALIALPPAAGRPAWVLSCSPELFIAQDEGTLTARPMKGTAPRSGDPAADEAQAHWLRHDPKNRAENLMIVDLLRNDLGRLAQTGTVKVPELFAVAPHGAVWQMTSTITARLRDQLSFTDLLRASFPCGSITGAPKRHTMQLIQQLEDTPRGLYTGSIGWVDATGPDRQSWACCLSVAIRTVCVSAPDAQGRHAIEMGVGSGIVLDSEAESEYAECQLKARFLTGVVQQTSHDTSQPTPATAAACPL